MWAQQGVEQVDMRPEAECSTASATAPQPYLALSAALLPKGLTVEKLRLFGTPLPDCFQLTSSLEKQLQELQNDTMLVGHTPKSSSDDLRPLIFQDLLGF